MESRDNPERARELQLQPEKQLIPDFPPEHYLYKWVPVGNRTFVRSDYIGAMTLTDDMAGGWELILYVEGKEFTWRSNTSDKLAFLDLVEKAFTPEILKVISDFLEP